MSRSLTYAVVTFGCRVNQADSAGIEAELLARGVTPSAAEVADLVVVNTCSVTASADQGARQIIRRIARSNPAAQVVVTGCYATRRPDEVGALPNVIRVVPNDDKPALGTMLSATLQTLRAGRGADAEPESTTATRFGDGHGSCGAWLEPGVAGRTSLTLRVQTGCAEGCTYCIIPSTRGRPRSLSPEDVLREAARAVSAGFKEIVLTGVHLGSYGRDLTPSGSLADLLFRLARAAAADREREVRFRVSSLEPMDCSDDVVGIVAEHAVFAPHFHLPLQHASNRMLQAMGRPYSIERYAALLDAVRGRLPDASIGTDIIVGFPGEREDDFVQLTSFLERSPLTHLHVFPYSDRPGTQAARRADKVRGELVRERARAVRDISRRLTSRFHDRQVGQRHRALTIDDGLMAVTGNYLKVALPERQPRNAWVTVRLDQVRPSLAGTIVSAGSPNQV